jgi:gamma-glutamyltranspeptidase/glutathione hydrolase
MVATSQRFATEAGVALLRAGGNAADAAIAAAAALAVTEPCSTGLGGDAFAIYYDADAFATALDGSGRSPAALRPGCEWSPYHANTVTVPGACAAWCDLVERHGSKRMSEILAPAIWLAEQGFEPAPIARHFWKLGLARVGSRELTLDGPRFRNPGMAHTLRTIADGGKDAFYRGPIARSIVRAVREAGGVLSEEDLAAHASTWAKPISTTFRDVRVLECPPNGQGIVALIALNAFEPEPPSTGVERAHVLIESLRCAFAEAREHVGGYDAVPVESLLAKRPHRVPRDRATLPGPLSSGSDTVYLCTVDAEGNACSFINSNYMGFGTGIVPTGCGFSLQNRGYNFSLEPTHHNGIGPHKRPYHTIMPGMITRADASLYGPFGVMGGFMQPQGHVQVVVGMVDDGLDPQAVLDRPRFCIDKDGVALEEGVPREIVEGLAARGHRVRLVTGWERSLFGRGQIIVREPDGTLVGGSDGRADGVALGT